MAGWWYTYPSEKYDFVSWDDDIPNIWKTTVYNQHVPKHQPDFMTFSVYVWNQRPVMAKNILILITKSHKRHVPEHQPVTIVNGFIVVYKPTITINNQHVTSPFNNECYTVYEKNIPNLWPHHRSSRHKSQVWPSSGPSSSARRGQHW